MQNTSEKFSAALASRHEELTRLEAFSESLNNGETDFEIAGYDRATATPASVKAAIDASVQKQSDINGAMVQRCVDKLGITTTLIRMQDIHDRLTMGRGKKMQKELAERRSEDDLAMVSLYNQFKALQEERTQRGFTPVERSETTYATTYVMHYEQFATRAISLRQNWVEMFTRDGGTVESLTAEIKELRAKFIDHSLKDSAALIEGIACKLEQAAILEMAIEDGVVPADEATLDRIADLEIGAGDDISSTQMTLVFIEDFLKEEAVSLTKESYRPASIAGASVIKLDSVA